MKYKNPIDYLSKVGWDDKAYVIIQAFYGFLFACGVFVLSMCIVEMRKPERIEWVRRTNKREDDEEHRDRIRQERKQAIEEMKLAY